MAAQTRPPLDLGPIAGESIVLCGFMGVGKTTVGRRLARRLDRRFIDLDELVSARLGRSIPELFAQGDEVLFRATESEILSELVATDEPSVISLGGGTYDNPETRDMLRTRALVIHLDQSWKALYPAINRLRTNRPMLIGRTTEEIRSLYESRRANYLLADLTVTMERAGVAAATREVVDALIAYVDAISN